MTCSNCEKLNSQLHRSEKKATFWRERYLIEKKCYKMICNWVLAVFGFTVKATYDRQSSTVKAEGAPRQGFKTKALVNYNSGSARNLSERKVFMMEGKLLAEDLQDDPMDLALLSLTLNDLGTENTIPSYCSTAEGQYDNLVTVNIPSLIQQQQSSLVNVQTQSNNSNNFISTASATAATMDIGQPSNPSSLLAHKDDVLLVDGSGQYFIIQGNTDGILQGGTQFTDQRNLDETDNIQQRSAITDRQTEISDARTRAVTSAEALTVSTTVTTPIVYNVISSVTKPAVTNSLLPLKSSSGEHKLQSNVPRVSCVAQAGVKSTSSDNIESTKAESVPTYSSLSFGLTLREKAEMYVLQKAREALLEEASGFKCSVCSNGHVYYSRESGIAHTRTHFDSKPYKCEQCDEKFAIQRHLSNHKRSEHPKLKITATNPPKKRPCLVLPK